MKKLHPNLIAIIVLHVLIGCQNTIVTPERITEQDGLYELATWSPDGKSIAYYTGSDGQIEKMDLETEAKQVIAILRTNTESITSIKWIGENTIAYNLVPKDNGADPSRLMVFDIVTNELLEYLSIEGKIHDFCWNNSSNTPVIVGTEKSYNGITLTYGNKLFGFDQTSNDLQIVYQIPDSSHGIDGVACHPENDEIAFVEIRDEPDKLGNNSQLYILSEGYEKQRSLLDETDAWSFGKVTWSNNGQWIATHTYNHKGRLDGITIVPTTDDETSTIKTIWLSIDLDEAVDWSPIEDKLLLRSTNVLGETYLFSLDLSPWLNN